MHPILYQFPFSWPWSAEPISIKSYGFMLMIGFMTAIWMTMRRASTLRGDPDVVLNMGFLALIFGVVGARVFFVVHYWEESFAARPSPLREALNISAGGLEFYGGLLCAMGSIVVYLLLTRRSIRWYLDLLAPAAMWGLAWGRVGCFLNGCCWGGVCESPHLPWAVTFPYGSPAFVQHVQQAKVSLPAELQAVGSHGEIIPLRYSVLHVTSEELQALQRDYVEAAQTYGKDHPRTKRARVRLGRYENVLDSTERYGLTVEDLGATAKGLRSRPVHPAQLYGLINAVLLSFLLAAILYRRPRHGAVFGWMMVIYPISRIMLEVIRTDNPLDSLGLTISQAVSVGMLAVAAGWFVLIYLLPAESPRALLVPARSAGEPAGR